MIEQRAAFDDAEKTAQLFAWSYFAFHAQQRQTVFNFFVVLIGASLAAFAATIDKPAAAKLHAAIGCVLTICSFLFWRLDERSRCLIQLAEASLKEIEVRLIDRTGLARLNILARSDDKIGGVFERVESFTQIYRIAFILIGLSGLGIVLRSISLCTQ